MGSRLLTEDDHKTCRDCGASLAGKDCHFRYCPECAEARRKKRAVDYCAERRRRARPRVCLDCGASIAHRGPKARRCEKHAGTRRRNREFTPVQPMPYWREIRGWCRECGGWTSMWGIYMRKYRRHVNVCRECAVGVLNRV